ncbi:MAG: hypothetical protein QOE87_1217, partial [Gaiellales bacterium]|nr:hypothetical protein [Gaiellales bacterium]
MRATGCLCALLGTLLALPPGIAEAKITPLPKPKSISAKPATSGHGSLIAPVTRPVTRTTIRPAAKLPPRPHIVSAPSAPAALRTTAGRPVLGATSAPRRHRFVPAVISGGRERGW